MKVGILCENYFPTLGGEQEHLLNLRRHLENPVDDLAPIDVRLVVSQPSYQAWYGPPDDAHVLRPARSVRLHGDGTSVQSTMSPRAYGALRALFARERFDLLHIHAPHDPGLSSWALWTFNGPIVGTLHSYFTHTPTRVLLAPYYRYVMRRLTRVIAVSEAARDAIARYADFDCTIIGNGVDCAAFAKGRRMPRLDDGLKNILMVGRLEQRNGVDIVIDAFARLATRRSDVRLVLAGDGASRRQYEAQVARLPVAIADRVVFLGAVWSERADLYASADCVAIAARKTSFSILLLEALAAGLRVAALPGEGASQAGPHWSLAELAASQSAEDYCDALSRALAPATPEYVARARAMAGDHDWQRIVPRIRRVYEEAISRTPA